MNPLRNTVEPATYDLAGEIAAEFAALAPVEAVWLGGSHASGDANASSDVDLYVYTSVELTVEDRSSIIKPRASVAEVGYDIWEVEDY